MELPVDGKKTETKRGLTQSHTAAKGVLPHQRGTQVEQVYKVKQVSGAPYSALNVAPQFSALSNLGVAHSELCLRGCVAVQEKCESHTPWSLFILKSPDVLKGTSKVVPRMLKAKDYPREPLTLSAGKPHKE